MKATVNSLGGFMPAPSLITEHAILTAARSELEAHGTDLTMSALAARLGVRAPSLYKHVRDRDDVLERLRTETLDELRAQYDAITAADPAERITAIARATRAYAARLPRSKALAFTPVAGEESVSQLAHTVAPLVEACRDLVGSDDALNAARTVTAWMHGFSEMEALGAFHLGGSVEESFRYGLDLLVTALAAARTPG